MIDCGESDNVIEICGKLDKSNTQNRFKGAIFCSFISYYENFQTESFSEFFYE